MLSASVPVVASQLPASQYQRPTAMLGGVLTTNTSVPVVAANCATKLPGAVAPNWP